MDVLGVTPNELLLGEYANTSHIENYIMELIRREEDFEVSLQNLPASDYFHNYNEWQFYMRVKLSEYISNYVEDIKTDIEDLWEIKRLVQRQKTERLMKCYRTLHSMDRYNYDAYYGGSQKEKIACPYPL